MVWGFTTEPASFTCCEHNAEGRVRSAWNCPVPQQVPQKCSLTPVHLFWPVFTMSRSASGPREELGLFHQALFSPGGWAGSEQLPQRAACTRGDRCLWGGVSDGCTTDARRGDVWACISLGSRDQTDRGFSHVSSRLDVRESILGALSSGPRGCPGTQDVLILVCGLPGKGFSDGVLQTPRESTDKTCEVVACELWAKMVSLD